MKLTDAQNSVCNYLKENQIGTVMLQFSKLLLLLYPCFLLIQNIDFLDPVADIFVYLREIMYFCYFAGIVACFAKGEMIFIALAFAIKTLVEFIGFIRLLDASYSPDAYYYINYVIDIAVYGFVTYITFVLAQKKPQ